MTGILNIYMTSFSKLFYKVADATNSVHPVTFAPNITELVASPQEQPLCEILLFMRVL